MVVKKGRRHLTKKVIIFFIKTGGQSVWSYFVEKQRERERESCCKIHIFYGFEFNNFLWFKHI